MSPRILLGCGLVILGTELGAASTASALTWYVDGSAPGPAQNGQAWCTAFIHVQDALAVAALGDEIRVANGTYFPDRGAGQTLGNRSATFLMRSGVALRGGYAGCGAGNPDGRDFALNETILSGDLLGNDGANFVSNLENAYHVVTNNDPATTNSTVLDGFTIVGGNANGTLAAKTDQGSGIHNFNGVNPFTGKPLVQNCVLKNNWAGNHGAFNDHGGATLINCEFRDNHAGMWGGGLYIHDTLPTIVTDCRFINNHTDGTSGGGGGVVHEGQAVFTRCVFTGNSSKNHGGGFYNHGGGAPTLIDCDFEDNSATDMTLTSPSRGGGLYSQDGSLTLIRSTFTGNWVFHQAGNTGGGAALYALNTLGTLTDCLFEANDSNYTAGALYLAPDSNMTIEDCRFVANHAYYNAGIYVRGPNSPVIRRCEFRDGVATYGGGVRLVNSDARISDSYFFNNSAENAGGAISTVGNAHPIIANCTFVANHTNGALGAGGGAIETNTDFTTITNCVFIANSADTHGGAIHALTRGNGKFHTIIGCTFAGNSAANGRAVAVRPPGVGTPGGLVMANSILHNGGSEIWFDPTIVVASTITYSLVSGGWPGAGNISGDPLFADLDGSDNLLGTMDDSAHLALNSPCIDAGDTAALLPDALDLDDDGDTTEPTPIDLEGANRVFDHPAVNNTGNPPGSGPAVDMGALEAGDCNGNGVFDEQDISGGSSPDCNANGLPDECESDCNTNGVSDDCDVTAGTSLDCNANLIPDECETDCNTNNVPDDCDISTCPFGNFTCGDCDGDGLPNECELLDPCPPGMPSGPFNRYLAFFPGIDSAVRAFRVDKLDSGPLGGPAGSCWIAVPNAQRLATCTSAPVFRVWSEPVVYVGDCEIVPVADYEIRATSDGTFFSPPTTVSTTGEPTLNGKKWGDVAGINNGSAWTPPNGYANLADILAVLAYIKGAAVKPEFQRANLQAVSSNDSCLNAFVNTADVLILVKAVNGDAYPFTTNPASCPVCP